MSDESSTDPLYLRPGDPGYEDALRRANEVHLVTGAPERGIFATAAGMLLLGLHMTAHRIKCWWTDKYERYSL